jgi:hypothetical protein
MRPRPQGFTLPVLLLAGVAVLAAAILLTLPAAPAAATGVNLGPRPLEPAATGGLATLDRALAKLSTHKRLLVIARHGRRGRLPLAEPR